MVNANSTPPLKSKINQAYSRTRDFTLSCLSKRKTDDQVLREYKTLCVHNYILLVCCLFCLSEVCFQQFFATVCVILSQVLQQRCILNFICDCIISHLMWLSILPNFVFFVTIDLLCLFLQKYFSCQFFNTLILLSFVVIRIYTTF